MMPWGLTPAHIVILLVPIGAVVLIAVAVVRAVASPQSPAGPPLDDALATLRLRYARGEISEAEFEQMKETLGA
jgi:putative membrane protein